MLQWTVTKRVFVILWVLSGIGGFTLAASENDTSAEWVYRKHPKRVAGLFAGLDLDRKGMERVKSAVEKKDFPAACRELLKYYRQGNSGKWLRKNLPKPAKKTDPSAEKMLNDTFTFQSVEGRVPRLKTGRLKWTHNGPEKDYQWGLFLNRHYHLESLLKAYFRTGNTAYAHCIDKHIRDWIVSNPCPDKPTPYISESFSIPQWGLLEVCFRVRNWAEVFYALQKARSLTPAARILMLSSIPEHAELLRRYHWNNHNHAVMELNGLAAAATCFPEFRDATGWLKHAQKRMLAEIDSQVYPDGVQKELTSHYHYCALLYFEGFAQTLACAGHQTPTPFSAQLEKMWNYLAYAIRPDGHGPMNNDSDRDFNRQRVLDAAGRFKRPDWTYVAANGRKGKKPRGLPSIAFPWAGQLIMRSGWDADAHWAFFDVGSWGMSHQHYDKLHLSVSAYGRDLLVDGGRYTYNDYDGPSGTWRGYFVGSASHNVILIDGHGQNRCEPLTSKPLKKDSFAVKPAFDFARGVFGKGFKGVKGKAVHARAVLYVRGKFWVVVDRITTDRPRGIEVLWHYHPDCTVVIEDGSVTSTDAGKGNIRIVPATDLPWKVEIVNGREKPDIQGWYSVRYNVKEPNPTAVYSASVSKTATFAWVLVPARGSASRVKAQVVTKDENKVRVRIVLPREQPVEVTVPLKNGKPGVKPLKADTPVW